MKLILKSTLILICLWVGGTSHAQTVISNVISDYYNNNKRDSAMLLIDQYLPIYERQKKWDSVVILNRYKTLVYASTKSPKESVVQSNYTIGLAEKHFADSSKLYMLTLLKHAKTLSFNFQFKESQKNFKKLIQLCDKYDNYYSYKARALSNLAYLDFSNKEYEKALDKTNRALDVLRQDSDIDSVIYINIYQTLGSTYEHLAMPDSSYKYKQLFLDLILRSYPPNHVNVGIAYNDMAGFYLEKGLYDKALKSFKNCEAIFYQDYLKNGQGRYLAVPIANIGYIYSLLGEYSLTNEYYVKSLELGTHDYGANHMGNYDILTKLAANACNNNELSQVKNYYNRAMKILEVTK